MVDAVEAADLQRAFQADLRGEARFDPLSRTLYSTDASNHRIQPLGVVIPRVEEDLFAIVERAAELDVPLIPRGGGTGLAGQTLGRAVIVDVSKHLNKIHHIDPEAMLAEVDPGVVCAVLNRTAGRHGIQYGPDPASADRATVGGMLGNNATGAHSIRYGMSSDNVISLDVVLSDSSAATFGSMEVPDALRKAGQDNLEGRVYRTALDLREAYADEIARRWPHTWRRASGYGLNYLTGYTPSEPPAWYAAPDPYPPADGFNLARVLCGSEGTLALTRRARLRLVPKPKHTLLAVLTFDSVVQAAQRTPGILETEPSAVELLPYTLMERARSVPGYARHLTFVDEIPEALLVVEFAGEDPKALEAAAAQLGPGTKLLRTPEAQNDLWTVRKAGLGLLMSVPGDTKPITFIEDVAVPVEKLAAYVQEVDRILDAEGTYAEWYAHASAGCLHLRPMINLKTAEGVHQMRSIADAVGDLVIAMQGTMSGEHGDGFSHTEFNKRLFGPQLTQAFQELKSAFDPQRRFNPAKVVLFDDDEPPALHHSLRYGPEYGTVKLTTHFAHRREGSLAGAVEACTGLGVCRKDDGVMCPSYQATRDELHLTRGRANALRAAMSGALPPEMLTGERMHEVFDLCLECKGCKAECPTAVDMARIKAEFLAMYQAEHGVSLRSRLFGGIHNMSALAAPVGELVTAVSVWGSSRWMLEKILGISRHRRLPPFVRRGFTRRFSPKAGDFTGQPVLLFVDTYSEYNYPGIAEAAVKVLRAAGCEVLVERQQGCCGRPMISKGLLSKARRLAEHNLEVLAPYAERGIPIVGLEPSCVSAIKDEYLEFFPQDPRAQALAGGTHMIEAFLTQQDPEGTSPVEKLAFRKKLPGLDVHVHCHAKALFGSKATLDMLRASGAEVSEISSGCCGMAGSFGYEVEHYDVSMAVGGLKLFPAVRASAEGGRLVLAHGMSCRTQIHDGTDVTAAHPIQWLAEALADAR
jgi:FAD/FMN-containing dehydrogenase/Fe-S oxidoreductase